MSTQIFPFLFRRWRKNTAYSVLNIFGLAIGIACAGLIFLWIEDERSYDNFNVKKDRLYNVEVNMNADGNVWTMGSTPRPLRVRLSGRRWPIRWSRCGLSSNYLAAGVTFIPRFSS
jgi:hypothetical protein